MTVSRTNMEEEDQWKFHDAVSKALCRWLEQSIEGNFWPYFHENVKKYSVLMGIHCSLTDLNLRYMKFLEMKKMLPESDVGETRNNQWSRVMSAFEDLGHWLSYATKTDICKDEDQVGEESYLGFNNKIKS